MKNFDALYTENYQAVLTHVLTYVKDSNKAEDITADAFVKAYRHFNDFNPETANFLTWVKSIAKNQMIDNWRTDQFGRNTTSQENYVDEEGECLIQPMASEEADSEVLNTELRTKILKAIRNLKPQQRKIAVLRFLHEKEYNEICDELQLPMNTVKVTINRARAILQTALA